MKHLLLNLFASLFVLQLVGGADDIEFNRDVRPILSKNCFACHGPSEDAKASLHLHSFETATDAEHPKRKGRAAIIPGNPDKSRAIQLIESTDLDEIMPPPDSHKQLTDAEKQILREWVKQGANYQAHWSLIPLQEMTVPSNNASHPVDAFVQANLKKAKLAPQPAADKRTLIRRVSLDLTGLPPTPTQTQAFLADNSPKAYENLVDTLLASPAYGEHMARYWLDLVRYGDSHGIHGDNYREMYAYRDWVIKAFNNNQPFNEFTIDQLAGDLRDNPTTDQLIASGFNRLHVSNSAGSALKEELYFNNVVDRTSAFGTVFLGLTVGCAQCHDHKYDPISHKEFFELFAFFNNMDGPPDNAGKKSPAPALAVPTLDQQKQLDELAARLEKSQDDKTTKAIKKQLAGLKKQLPTTMIMRERKSIRDAFIFDRGQYDQPGTKVTRSTPAALPPMASSMSKDRMGLAQWVTAPNHPLTARVTVNRFWQQLFGRGLVRTSEDLGSQGEWPSHPELLDYLAKRFMDSGWDVKAIMLHLVLSETYRQRSDAGATAYQTDPDNRWLARGPRFRLDAEVLRDQALASSGLLVRDMYGPSVKPPQPPGLWKAVALPVSKPNSYKPDTGSKIYRRSVYTYIKRAYPPPSMSIFNAPTRESCVSRRERTNTPLQALVLMNEEQFFEAAGALADKILKMPASSDADRIDQLWEQVLARPATPEESEACMSYLKRARENFYERGQSIQLGRRSVEPETAGWTMLASAILNLDTTKTKE